MLEAKHNIVHFCTSIHVELFYKLNSPMDISQGKRTSHAPKCVCNHFYCSKSCGLNYSRTNCDCKQLLLQVIFRKFKNNRKIMRVDEKFSSDLGDTT